MTSNDALIRALSSNLVPVTRRSVGREAVIVASIVAAELLLLLSAGAARPDMGRVILSPYMLWKLGSLALLAGVTCAVALRSFAPPAAPGRGLALALGLGALAIAAGGFVTPGADGGQPLLIRLYPLQGMFCTMAIIVLALPILGGMAVLMRRAAPVRPAKSGLACGLAAAMSGALVFAVCCPANDPLYVVVWYAIGIAAVALAGRLLLSRRFRL